MFVHEMILYPRATLTTGPRCSKAGFRSPRIKLTKVLVFSGVCGILVTAHVLCSLRLFLVQTEGQPQNLGAKLQN